MPIYMTISTIRFKTCATCVLSLYAGLMSANAAIISDDSERRIYIRDGAGGSNVHISPSYNAPSSDPMNAIINQTNTDSMQGLINQKQRDFEFDAKLSIEENKRIKISPPTSQRYNTTYSQPSYNTRYSTPANNAGGFDSSNDFDNYDNDYGFTGRAMDFNSWLNSSSYRSQQVSNFQRYLGMQVGAQNVPPMSQLLTTARSWDKCGYEPYQLPPEELWSNMVPTLRLYKDLKAQGILPPSAQIRSVYRSPSLNSCAGGAQKSKHMTASAMDIWVPEYEGNAWRISELQDSLCQFWQYQGRYYDFGLGIYSTGAIHLDTQEYRKWGAQYTANYSACRY